MSMHCTRSMHCTMPIRCYFPHSAETGNVHVVLPRTLKAKENGGKRKFCFCFLHFLHLPVLFSLVLSMLLEIEETAPGSFFCKGSSDSTPYVDTASARRFKIREDPVRVRLRATSQVIHIVNPKPCCSGCLLLVCISVFCSTKTNVGFCWIMLNGLPKCRCACLRL